MFYKTMTIREKIYFARKFIQPGRNINPEMEDTVAGKQLNILAEIRRYSYKKGMDAKSFDENIVFYPITKCWQFLPSDWECCMCYSEKKDIYENAPNTMIAITIKCNHGFCAECVAQWFQKDTKCPLCRMEFKS